MNQKVVLSPGVRAEMLRERIQGRDRVLPFDIVWAAGDGRLLLPLLGASPEEVVANGELDLNNLARKELANRGLDKQGQWVGFDKANQIHNA